MPDTENGEGPTKVSMDYMYLHERVGEHRDIQHNPPYLIVVEHKFGRCWAYQVPNKGINDGAYWVPRRVLQDFENSGLGDTRIVHKTDQEPSIVCIQPVIQELKPIVVFVNSPAGESACNGRVENIIRRVHEKSRTLRSHVESKIGQPIPDQTPIMIWMARWAAELISKYAPGDDGKTPYERIRQEVCQVPLVPFGEMVMYLPMKIATASKDVPARKAGIWLGVVERTEEMIIGTKDGVVKCRIWSRMSKDDQWNRELVLHMKGLAWEPVPGKRNMHIPVDINDDGGDLEGDYGKVVRPAEALDDDVPDEVRGGLDKLHISRKAIAKYGPIPGCPGCNEVARRGHLPGKFMYHHSEACRQRVINHMKSDPEYRRLLHKHGYTLEVCTVEVMSKS